jgi:hypothetical protein
VYRALWVPFGDPSGSFNSASTPRTCSEASGKLQILGSLSDQSGPTANRGIPAAVGKIPRVDHVARSIREPEVAACAETLPGNLDHFTLRQVAVEHFLDS